MDRSYATHERVRCRSRITAGRDDGQPTSKEDPTMNTATNRYSAVFVSFLAVLLLTLWSVPAASATRSVDGFKRDCELMGGTISSGTQTNNRTGETKEMYSCLSSLGQQDCTTGVGLGGRHRCSTSWINSITPPTPKPGMTQPVPKPAVPKPGTAQPMPKPGITSPQQPGEPMPEGPGRPGEPMKTLPNMNTAPVKK